LSSRNLYMYRQRVIDYADRNYRHRLVSLWHANDEAVQGLRTLQHARFSIFRKDFAVPLITFVATLAAPVVIAYLMFYRSGIDTLVGKAAPLREADWVKHLTNTVSSLNQDTLIVLVITAFVGSFFIIPTVLIFLPSIVAVLLVTAASRQLSFWLSGVLDRVSWKEIRGSALGSDIRGEDQIDVQERPAWAAKGFLPLPVALGDEISAFSDEAASKSLSKMRRGIGDLAFRDKESDKASVVAQYLSWDELIHTCYFNVPRFRKLVAYAISCADGFCATDAFKADPEYVVVAKWFDEIKPQDDVVRGWSHRWGTRVIE
jgi:hypothetical protein